MKSLFTMNVYKNLISLYDCLPRNLQESWRFFFDIYGIYRILQINFKIFDSYRPKCYRKILSKKFNLSFYFHNSLWHLKKVFWNGMKTFTKTFPGSTKKGEHKSINQFFSLVQDPAVQVWIYRQNFWKLYFKKYAQSYEKWWKW